ncbi:MULTISPECIES: hypothetical protein [unclassified Bradyrhizobium]|uniref:hypothetical protein n=1 Tax=unclassified Bradyrhizobium TaxID=2631580 RepID=UPI002916C1F1|nr:MULTISPECIES: hypothetical protein [unclassified Bradyrhizobium]
MADTTTTGAQAPVSTATIVPVVSYVTNAINTAETATQASSVAPAPNAAPVTENASAPAAIDPETQYRVNLRTSIRVGRAKVHPGPRVLLRGDILSSVLASDATIVTGYARA